MAHKKAPASARKADRKATKLKNRAAKSVTASKKVKKSRLVKELKKLSKDLGLTSIVDPAHKWLNHVPVTVHAVERGQVWHIPVPSNTTRRAAMRRIEFR